LLRMGLEGTVRFGSALFGRRFGVDDAEVSLLRRTGIESEFVCGSFELIGAAMGVSVGGDCI
jgi:hypothetical protein